MHYFQIDSTIVESFLAGSDLTEYQDSEIYKIGQKDHEKSIFRIPYSKNIDRIRLLKMRLVNVLSTFTFSNEKRYYRFLLNSEEIERQIVIKLVVGMPQNIKKIFRNLENGQVAIILDLANYVETIDEYDDIVEDIEDYLGYAIALMVLDSSSTSDENNQVSVFEHAIYSTSFANYVSESNQLDFMRNLNYFDMWIFLEFDTIKKIMHHHKKAEKTAADYLSMAIQANPEMIVLGVTGKSLLEDYNEEEARELFDLGPKEFLKEISKNKDLNFVSKLTKTLSVFTASIIPLVIVWVIVGIVDLFQKTISLPFKILPLIIMLIVMLRDYFNYKLEKIAMVRFLIKIVINVSVTIVFLWLVID